MLQSQSSAGHADLKVGSWEPWTPKKSKEVGRISLLYYSAATFFELMSGSQTRDEFIASKGDPPATNLCLLHNLYPMYPNCLDDETTSCNPRD